MTILWNIAFFLILIGVLVTVHEFGHFWVARKCNVKVLRFAIGFGKPLLKWYDKQGTEYVIALIPLGGYVRMLDERMDEVTSADKAFAFNHKPVLQRIAIVAAGPAFNFIFAIFAFYLMLNIGVSSVKPVVGDIIEHSIADKAGLKSDSMIMAINGEKTVNWQSVQLELANLIGTSHAELSVSSGITEKPKVLKLDLTSWQVNPEKESLLTTLGITPFNPQILPIVVKVADNSPASDQLQVGDEIIRVNGELIQSWQQLDRQIKDNPEKKILFVVNRASQQTELFIELGVRTTAKNEKQGFLGIVPQVAPWPEKYKQIEKFTILSAFPESLERTWRTTVLSFAMVGKLISGDVSLNALGGPVSIAQGAGTTASYGIVYFLSFMAFISINLGIINLLPLPVLDGGHLLYYLIELLRGKPVPENIQAFGFRIGLMVIVSLMGIAIFNDLSRL